MADAIKSKSAESELRQFIEELARQSMSCHDLPEVRADAICERFSKLHRLAIEADLGGVADLAESLHSTLAKTGPEHLTDCLRAAVTQVQQKMESSAQTHSAAATIDCASEEMTLSDPGLIADFVVESREHLVAAEELALALEKEPGDAEAINALFRVFHSIKGLAAFLEFDRVYRFAHEVETLLDYARNRELVVTPAVIDLILASADFLSRCMDAIQSGGLSTLAETEGAIVNRVQEVIARSAVPGDSAKVDQPVPSSGSAPTGNPFEIDAESLPESAQPGTEVNGRPEAGMSTAEAPLAAGSTAEVTVPPGGNTANAERYSIRVDTNKLDYLMDIVGELVIAQSLMRTEIMTHSNAHLNLVRSVSRLTQITTDVQRTTLRMRMIPIGQLLRRSTRIVRDLARKCGKQVEIELEGEDTEVDKTIAEELADPLMHIVRNAIDHGVESPEVRLGAGKGPVAKIRLSASHEGGQIVVQVSDDGKGLDRAKIVKKARERNLVPDGNLTEADIVDLIFSPGFSTAEEITTVSGRGVGMDVVRKHVEKLRGRVDVVSTSGKGTKFIIRLPLTRAIIDGLVVRVGESRYVIPLSSVREIFRPLESAVSTVQEKGELVMLHNRLLPIVRLHRQLSVVPDITDPWAAVLIFAESGGREFCLMVDELIGKQEVVVKSLGQFLESTPGVSGGTILGDGRVGLILDVQKLEVRA
jgi:two-component system chemotaxis sensor kinase CheA